MSLHTKDLLSRCNITRDTLRHYRSCGLLAPHRNPRNGYLQYTEKDIERIHFIRDAQALGFTLQEIRTILHALHGAPCKHQALLPQLRAHRAAIDEKLRALQSLRVHLTRLIADFSTKDCTKSPSTLRIR